MPKIPVLKLAVASLVAIFLEVAPIQAQFTNIKDVLRNTPSSQLVFAENTVGAVISGFTNRVYLLNAMKGQTLSIDIHTMGARAGVAIYDVKSGNYYILCIAGPTNHYYDFTIRVEETK
jgi:predicted Co/Zn/Cd cation transporter (cation efflux family)